jgi:DNA-binding transcriptional LysR family regulator
VSTLDLRQLRYFVAVAENGQLTDAARRLQIAQPTLSQALAQLESQLGVGLLERHTRGVRLTDAGRVFLVKARAAVAAADEAAEAAHAFGRAESRVLAVGFEQLPLTRWAAIFQQLCQAQPGTRLRWEPLDFPLERRSPIEEVDVGLLTEPTPRPDLSSLILYREPRAVVMAATHPLAGRRELTVADVLDETWPGCHPAIDRRWRSFWTLDRERGGPARMSQERITSAAQGIELVASGQAIATVPVSMAEGFAHPGIVGVPVVDAGPASLALVWRTNQENPLVDALVRIAEAEVDGGDRAPAL